MLYAKLCALVFVVVASSQAASDLASPRTHTASHLRDDTHTSPALSAFTRYGRRPAAVDVDAAFVDKEDDMSFDVNDTQKAGDDFDDIDLEKDLDKETKADAALLKRTQDIIDGAKRDLAAAHRESNQDEKPLSFKDLGRITKDLGLSEEDLKDLDDIESGKIKLKRSASNANRNPDERPRDVPPPPGMVANPPEMKKMKQDDELNRDTQLDQPPAPNEPADVRLNSEKVTAASDKNTTTDLIQENAEYEERVLRLTRKLEVARRELDDASKETTNTKRKLSLLNVQFERAKGAFQRSLDSARDEESSEKEEMTATIKEQKRAFDELFEEKQLLSQMLSDEQKTLKELQEKIQHPDLGLWVRQRAERAAILVENPETDAVKYYAKKYMAPKVTKMRHRLELLEKRVERTVDHLLPAKYGSVVALLLSIGLVGFPIVVTMSTVVRVTKSVSLRQYALLGNVFLTAFAAGLCIAGVLLRQDPLQTLYEASETLFITLQLTTAVAFPIFLGVIGCAVLRSRDRLDAFVFGCEFVFYSLVAMNYRSRVWRPAMLGQNIETSVMMYAIYLMDFMSMTALTISSSRIEEGSMFRDADPEVGMGGKVTGTSGSGTLHGSVSSRVSSLSSGLIQAAMGHGRTGKQE